MKTLVIGFSRPKKFKLFAELIMFADMAPFSHGFVKFKSAAWGTEFIYQSSGHRTNFMGGKSFRSINTIVEEYALQLDDEIEAKVGRLCVEREGRKYPVLQVIGKGIVKLASCFGLSIKNPFSNGDEMSDCIEECAAILREGLDIKTPLDMDSVGVTEFRDWIKSLPMAKRIEEKQ
jgi:hypothetical protein